MIRIMMCLAAMLAMPVAARAENPRQPPFEGFDAYVAQALVDCKVPGLAIAVVKDGNVVCAAGYGVRRIGETAPVDEHTIFAIGSNTKAFTAAALGLLVEQGQISWDDAVIDHLRGFQMYDFYVTREITVRDLLCHRSGLQTWAGDLILWGSRYTPEEIVQRLRYLEPAYSFRSRFGYSNSMFVVAGQIIPAVTGIPWDRFIKQRVLEPLGMARTTTSVTELAGMDNVAAPHTLLDGEVVAIPYRNLEGAAPAGALNSCAADMARWLRLQLAEGTLDGKHFLDANIAR